ncbi:hypothetical protein PRIPAC_74526 [Pristionchus pacificus]|uniref:Uncharacterized protein n=1 Tax=Pristionchus pacificus TaxID=54126 RepID=A0A2A6C6D9_PRIPA|nr:hypothetical protein PRIPAC_74526 [Pristionchus pacificus]|eukprot:PDM73623.1 hypothetical protein PRIPAC_40979 [Pristionchus pacificus]
MDDDCLLLTQQEMKNVSKKMRSIIKHKNCMRRRRHARALEVERFVDYRELKVQYPGLGFPTWIQAGSSCPVASCTHLTYKVHFLSSVLTAFRHDAASTNTACDQLCEKYIFTTTYVFRNITIDRALFDYFKCKAFIPKRVIMHNVHFDGGITPAELREEMRNRGVGIFSFQNGQNDFLTTFNNGFFHEIVNDALSVEDASRSGRGMPRKKRSSFVALVKLVGPDYMMSNLETIDFMDDEQNVDGIALHEDIISTIKEDCLLSIFSYLTWRTQQEVKNVSRKMRAIVMNKNCRKRRLAQALEVERCLQHRQQNFLYFVKHIPLDDEKYGLSYRLNSDLTEEKIVYPHHPPYSNHYVRIRNSHDKEALPRQILKVIKELSEKYIFTTSYVFKNITIDRVLFDFFKCKAFFPKSVRMHNVHFDGGITPAELREEMRNSGARVFVWEEGQRDFLTFFNNGFFQEFSRF